MNFLRFNLRRRIIWATIFFSVALPRASSADELTAPGCTHQKSSFDGIAPLHYDSIIGDIGERVSIYPIDPSMCKEIDQADCKSKGYLIPGDKVAVTSSCGPWTQIQYIGKKVVVQGWIKSERLPPQDQYKELSSAPNKPTFPDPSRFKFRIVKGNGTPVCNAYLQRLNKSFFEQLPKCGRPENDEVPGFTKLNRVPLKPEEFEL